MFVLRNNHLFLYFKEILVQMLNILKCVSEEAVSHLSYYTIQNFSCTGIASWLPIPIDKQVPKYVQAKTLFNCAWAMCMINWLLFILHKE